MLGDIPSIIFSPPPPPPPPSPLGNCQSPFIRNRQSGNYLSRMTFSADGPSHKICAVFCSRLIEYPTPHHHSSENLQCLCKIMPCLPHGLGLCLPSTWARAMPSTWARAMPSTWARAMPFPHALQSRCYKHAQGMDSWRHSKCELMNTS